MRVGKVFVNIEGGTEDASGIGHVRINHGQEYSVSVSSDFDQPSNAVISIDGKQAGTWRIPAHGSIRIERPANAQRKFTFYRHGTSESSNLDSVHPSVSGVVSVRVIPGKPALPVYTAPPVYGDTFSFGSGMRGCASGMTGLGAPSSQRFGTAGDIDLDYGQEITVNLRLVCASEPVPFRDVRENQIPPKVWRESPRSAGV